MLTNLLDFVPLWVPFLLVCLFIGLPLVIGRKLRLLHQKLYGDVDSGSIGIVSGSLLGLLGFLLAFTFGMASTRFEDRRQAVLAEANVIGTAYLRADMLEEQQRFAAKHLLRKYVELRSNVAAAAMTREALPELITQSIAIHQDLWQVAVTAAKNDPSPISGLFVQATNDLIDAHSTRVMVGLQSTIPLEIWICLYVVAIFSLGSAGFHWASKENQSVYPFITLVLAFAVVLALVADLDDPAHGFIRTDQAPMLDLSRSLKAEPEHG